MTRLWINVIFAILCLQCRALMAADCSSTNLELPYSHDSYGQLYDLRGGEALIRATRKNEIWATDCDVPLQAEEMEQSNVCEHPKGFPKLNLSIKVMTENQYPVMTLKWAGKTFQSRLVPQYVFDNTKHIMYMESEQRFIYGDHAYDVYVYFRLHAAQGNSTYKTYRVEFFDVADEDCRRYEAPSVPGVIQMARWVSLPDGKRVDVEEFARSIRVTKNPVHLDESQVGDGTEPRR